jgi:dodecin
MPVLPMLRDYRRSRQPRTPRRAAFGAAALRHRRRGCAAAGAVPVLARCGYHGSAAAARFGCRGRLVEKHRRMVMAKKSAASEGVYRVTEVIGTSTISWEDAAKNAVSAASKSLRDLRIAEIGKLDMKVEGGKVVAFRARVSLSFKYEA